MPTEYTTCCAVISADDKYRYQLIRAWDDNTARCVFIMLNPSTADGAEDDPTIRRCVGFAKRFGFGGLVVVNLFAFRATDPAVMYAEREAVGPDNDAHILGALAAGDRVFAAWGASANRKVNERAYAVRCMAARAYVPLEALKLSGGGAPCHPLYLPAVLDPVPYPHPGASSW